MSYNTPVRHLQMGSQIEVNPSGTIVLQSGGSIQVAAGAVLSVAGSIVIAAGGAFNNAAGTSTSGGLTIIASGGTHLYQSGGSLQVASGGNINVAAITGFSAPAGISLGGTLAKWAFGTVTLTSGVGTIGLPGFTQVLSATSSVVLGEASGAGSTTSVQTDLSLSGAGSIIFHTAIGTLPGNVTRNIAWIAFGT